MLNISDEKQATTLDIYEEERLPIPIRIDLKTIDDVRLEMARVYRDMRAERILANDGTRLVYVLGQIGKMIELHEIIKRVEKLEEKL